MGVLFSEGRFFHDLQVQVSYPHAADWPLPDAPEPQRLARSDAKLKAKQTLKLVALGDSITEGYNASPLPLKHGKGQPIHRSKTTK
jgi:hypothetical protein